jgi:hypothetical protein
MGVSAMYHPYFRGKQYELITVREMAPLLKKANFRPIIEPVRESLSGLHKALDTVVRTGGKAIVIVNPNYGDLSNAGRPLTELLQTRFLDLPNIAAGIILQPGMTLPAIQALYIAHQSHSPVFVHAGFSDGRGLAAMLEQQNQNQCHVFFDDPAGKLYRSHFKRANRVLIRDGFKRKRNRDYDLEETFSDLHVLYEEEGMQGFGDFLIVGDDYTEGGGPAYAVAIHLTFIDPEQDHLMKIYHFKSRRQNDPKDPAGKFAEALDEMMEVLDNTTGGQRVLDTAAVQEFRALHRDGHFPGLGYVKKLSMNHHIETLAHYFGVAP